MLLVQSAPRLHEPAERRGHARAQGGRVEAYRSDGTFLWSMDMGDNSLDLNNIEGGSSGLDTGNRDGVTVYDFDGDGKAEVAARPRRGRRPR
ncbi:hypothetical protein [Streptomyces sp. NPDC003247]|uniref:rhamnogalacturonan lyase family protein n=1 Tax=Streptomyces sp. NPDC003247 TaxID=3364677 RepID=UPI00369EC3FB